MTFIERYQIAETWQEKALVMSLYHLAASERKDWTIKKTALVFGVSIGLASENIKLANAIDSGSHVINCKTRQEALTKLERKRYVS